MKIFKYIILGVLALATLFVVYLLLELFAFSSQYESYGNKIIVHGLLSGRQEFTAYTPTKEICEQISPDIYQVAFMNGGNQKIMYVRSYCFWQAALENKDEALCQYVVEKKHFLYNGSYFTAESCRQEVNKLK